MPRPSGATPTLPNHVSGAILGVIGVVLAIAVPLYVEFSRRPVLRIERADDLNVEARGYRIVHVRVISEPLTGWRARWLLRNDAVGCKVQVTCRSRSDGREYVAAGRWSATPEPLALAPDLKGFVFDPGKVPQTERFDLSPDATGEILGVAIKYDGDADAYIFGPWSYMHPRLCDPAYRLPDTEYDVYIEARAGEIVRRAHLVLANEGDGRTGLALRAAA